MKSKKKQIGILISTYQQNDQRPNLIFQLQIRGPIWSELQD